LDLAELAVLNSRGRPPKDGKNNEAENR
jgi:hypothetical protein